MSETVATSEDGRFRVVLEQDTDADPGDRQGAGYVFYVDYSGRMPAIVADEYDKTGATVVRDQLAGAYVRFGNDLDMIGRYFRTIGCQLDYFDTRDGRYVAIVTPELAAVWGSDPDTVTPDLSEFRAREDGDVYGYVIEEACVWTTNTIGGPRTREGWETVDYVDGSLLGMYGRDYAEETARESFGHFLASVEVSA